jgi:hypothetical protein
MAARSWDGYIRFDDTELAALQRYGVESERVEAMRRTRDEFDATHDRGHEGACDCTCGCPDNVKRWEG